MFAQTQGERRHYFSLTLKMSYLKSRINPELPLTNSTEETTFDKNETSLGKCKRTAWNHDMEKKTAMTDSQNTNECHERLDSITAKEYNTDDLTVFLNRKTTPTLKRLSWTTEEKETLPLVCRRHHTGGRVILLVLCLLCAAALGLSLLMLFGVLRPHCSVHAKIGKYESPHCLCNLFPLNYLNTITATANTRNLTNNCDKSTCLPLKNDSTNVPSQVIQKDTTNQEMLSNVKSLSKKKL